MNNFSVFNPNLPKLSVTKQELADLVCDALSFNITSFEFGNLISTIGQTCAKNRIGIPSDNTTAFNEILDGQDKVRVREVVWDFIILRYLTIGDYYNDSWPHLTVTESGRKFFSDRPVPINNRQKLESDNE